MAVSLGCEVGPVAALDIFSRAAPEREVHTRTAFVSAEATEAKAAEQSGRGAGLARGPYYVDFRARTAASWGHAFVWFGKTGERAVEVAGLTPAGDTLPYVLGHLMPVPSETGASYGDLDPQYLTASYRVYLNEPDAKRVFAYIKEPAGEFTYLERRNLQLHFVHRQHCKVYGTESSITLEPS